MDLLKLCVVKAEWFYRDKKRAKIFALCLLVMLYQGIWREKCIEVDFEIPRSPY